jgi:hypothetical protein
VTERPETAVGRGGGKVIVAGEHAVVFGHAAVAGALDRGVQACAARRPGPLTLAVDGSFAVAVTAGDDHPVAVALTTIADALGVSDGGRGDRDRHGARRRRAGLVGGADGGDRARAGGRWSVGRSIPTPRRRWPTPASGRFTARPAASTRPWRRAAAGAGSCAAPA